MMRFILVPGSKAGKQQVRKLLRFLLYSQQASGTAAVILQRVTLMAPQSIFLHLSVI